ncbi:unnamed protein product [Rhodiola kirilowii]
MQPAMVNPYTSASKTAEIMSRYRPIAPKPMEGGATAVQGGDGVSGSGGGYGYGSSLDGMSEKIQQSPYLRNLWPKLQARPTRTRKRGRMMGVSVSPTAFKRPSPPQAAGIRGAAATFLGITPPPQCYLINNGWFGQRFVAAGAVEKTISPPDKTATGMGNGTLVTLPLLPSSPVSAASPERSARVVKGVDLKSLMEMTPDENNLTLQLRGPVESFASRKVISPRPIRPIGSCITVISLTSVNEKSTTHLTTFKTAAEVEAEIEAEEVPAIVTDSRNRARLTNSAYNEMVGQPECMWLGSMGGGRIGGEVVIKATGEAAAVEERGTTGFKGWVKIEWGSKEAKKAAMDACCDVKRLRCLSKDYVFAWRFKTV